MLSHKHFAIVCLLLVSIGNLSCAAAGPFAGNRRLLHQRSVKDAAVNVIYLSGEELEDLKGMDPNELQQAVLDLMHPSSSSTDTHKADDHKETTQASRTAEEDTSSPYESTPQPKADKDTRKDPEEEPASSSSGQSALASAINRYRNQHGLSTVPGSSSLTTVASTHVSSLSQSTLSSGCNLHSWPESVRGASSCCYTGNHANPHCMWDKPAQLTSYSSEGFEIAASGSGRSMSTDAIADQAVSMWAGSSAHNDVVLNQGPWNRQWKALGCAISDSGSSWYASCWFGMTSD